jgi:hypothetical protein
MTDGDNVVRQKHKPTNKKRGKKMDRWQKKCITDEVARLAHAVKYEQWDRIERHLQVLGSYVARNRKANNDRIIAELQEMMKAKRGA